MVDWQHREFDPPDGGLDQGQWQVHISLVPSEVDAVRRFASQVVPAENFEVHTELSEGGSEGEVIFAIRVIAATADQATGIDSRDEQSPRVAAPGQRSGLRGASGRHWSEWSDQYNHARVLTDFVMENEGELFFTSSSNGRVSWSTDW